jgi:glycine cleavage system aminomethyltransferase T
MRLQGKLLADARIFCARDFLIVDIPEREVGTITSCRFSAHTNSAVALGYVQRNLIPRACVTIRDGEQSFVATVSLFLFRSKPKMLSEGVYLFL